MTKEFDKFIENILGESYDLPTTCPYGFWISPSGQAIPVPYEAHGDVALKIIDKNPKYKEEFEPNVSGFTDHTAMLLLAMGLLKNKGWIKAVKETMHTQTLWYSYKIPPTQKQRKELKDLSVMYDMQLEVDIGRKRPNVRAVWECLTAGDVLGNDGPYDVSDVRTPSILGSTKRRRRKKKKRS
jgi:hypothetical protein